MHLAKQRLCVPLLRLRLRGLGLRKRNGLRSVDSRSGYAKPQGRIVTPEGLLRVGGTLHGCR